MFECCFTQGFFLSELLKENTSFLFLSHKPSKISEVRSLLYWGGSLTRWLFKKKFFFLANKSKSVLPSFSLSHITGFIFLLILCLHDYCLPLPLFTRTSAPQRPGSSVLPPVSPGSLTLSACNWCSGHIQWVNKARMTTKGVIFPSAQKSDSTMKTQTYHGKYIKAISS